MLKFCEKVQFDLHYVLIYGKIYTGLWMSQNAVFYGENEPVILGHGLF